MATIAIADFLIETKRIAKIIDLFIAACGTGSETNTTSKGGANAKTAVLALGDADQVNALLPAASVLAEALKTTQYYGGLTAWIKALSDHVEGINDFLSDESSYVHFNLRAAYPKLQARYVFPPVTELANALYNGSWVDTCEVNTIDIDSYGHALIEFHTESVIGAADIDVVITGENYDGEVVQTSGTIPTATGDDTVVAIAGSVRFVKITDLEITGGTASDAFRIDTKFDRTPTGCA